MHNHACLLCGVAMRSTEYFHLDKDSTLISFCTLLNYRPENCLVHESIFHSDAFMFCVNCHAQISDAHETYGQLERILDKIAYYEKEVRKTILRAYTAGERKGKLSSPTSIMRKIIIKKYQLVVKRLPNTIGFGTHSKPLTIEKRIHAHATIEKCDDDCVIIEDNVYQHATITNHNDENRDIEKGLDDLVIENSIDQDETIEKSMDLHDTMESRDGDCVIFEDSSDQDTEIHDDYPNRDIEESKDDVIETSIDQHGIIENIDNQSQDIEMCNDQNVTVENFENYNDQLITIAMESGQLLTIENSTDQLLTIENSTDQLVTIENGNDKIVSTEGSDAQQIAIESNNDHDQHFYFKKISEDTNYPKSSNNKDTSAALKEGTEKSTIMCTALPEKNALITQHHSNEDNCIIIQLPQHFPSEGDPHASPNISTLKSALKRPASVVKQLPTPNDSKVNSRVKSKRVNSKVKSKRVNSKVNFEAAEPPDTSLPTGDGHNGEISGSEINVIGDDRDFDIEIPVKKRKNERLTHSGDFPCEICTEPFKRRRARNDHMKTHYPIDLKCADCGDDFFNTKRLKKHVRITHNKELSVECPECSKKFNNHYELAIHYVCHIDETRIVCDKCGKRFKLLRYLKVHEALAHKLRAEENAESAKFKCPTCGKVFLSRAHLRIHTEAHSTERPFTCPIPECSKTFLNQYRVDMHLKVTHDPSRSFICDQCGKASKTKMAMATHALTHSTDTSHVCSDCGLGFKSPLHLKRHAACHVTILPFKCSDCHKCFKTKYKLKMHSTLHTGEKAFVCDACGMRFRLSSNCRTHKKQGCSNRK